MEEGQHKLEVQFGKDGVPTLLFNEMSDDCKSSMYPPTFSAHILTDNIYQAKDVLSYYVLEQPIEFDENLDKAGLPVYPIEEFNRYRGLKTYWLITSPNY